MDKIGLLAKWGEEVAGLGWFPGQRAQVGLDTDHLVVGFWDLSTSPSTPLNPFLFANSPIPSHLQFPEGHSTVLSSPQPSPAPDQINPPPAPEQI